jgi:hypothetical protein
MEAVVVTWGQIDDHEANFPVSEPGLRDDPLHRRLKAIVLGLFEPEPELINRVSVPFDAVHRKRVCINHSK